MSIFYEYGNEKLICHKFGHTYHTEVRFISCFPILLIFSCILVFICYLKSAGYYSRLVIQKIWASYIVVQYNL